MYIILLFLCQTTGDFDVAASDVLCTSRQVVETKLGTEEDLVSTQDLQLQQVLTQLSENLKNSNVLDLMDILAKVKSEIKQNETLANKMKNTNFIVLKTPKGTVQV